jgi:hypothetical protein
MMGQISQFHFLMNPGTAAKLTTNQGNMTDMPHKQVSNNHKEGLVMYLERPHFPHEANRLPSPMIPAHVRSGEGMCKKHYDL